MAFITSMGKLTLPSMPDYTKADTYKPVWKFTYTYVYMPNCDYMYECVRMY